MNKPENFPDWCMKNNKNGINNTSTKFEYPQAKKDDGWDIDEAPPREWENYWKNLTAIWLRYLDEQLQKVSVVGVPVGIVLPTFPSLGGYKCVALEKADEFGFVLCNGQTINDQSSSFNGKIIPNLNNNSFLKGSIKDNVSSGNKENKINYNHTHNYAHTHAVSKIKVAGVSTPKYVQTFNEKPNRKESEWDYNLTFNGTSRTSDTGNTMLLISNAHETKILYSSGVSGDAVNGELDAAETATVSGSSELNIEPQNVTTVYIIRIK